MRDQFSNKLAKLSTVAIQIFLGNGAMLADKAAVEDYHANSIVSHEHRMSFKMRKPARLYAAVRDGLPPAKTRSKHLFSRTDLYPGMDLATVIQLGSVWYAAMTGTTKEDNLERKASVWMRLLAVGGAVAIVLVAFWVKSQRQPEAQPVAWLLTGGGLI